MSDQALYRKYRPEAFSDLVGQEHIVASLEGALEPRASRDGLLAIWQAPKAY